MAKRRYSNGKITVFWDSEKCIRSGKCDGQLPQVFNPGKRPWVDLSASDAETVARVIDTCPTGALSYELPGRPKPGAPTIRVMERGPYRVSGPCCLVDKDGKVLEPGDSFALCRCGASHKMPFCDGAHYHTSLDQKG